jgi:hypothetical protein
MGLRGSEDFQLTTLTEKGKMPFYVEAVCLTEGAVLWKILTCDIKEINLFELDFQ